MSDGDEDQESTAALWMHQECKGHMGPQGLPALRKQAAENALLQTASETGKLAPDKLLTSIIGSPMLPGPPAYYFQCCQ